MIVLRSALFEVLRALATIVFSCIALLTFPLPPFTRYRIITVWNRLLIWLARAICGIDYRVRGLENLPREPAIVLAKHQSSWETFLLPVLLPPSAIVIKRELLRIPFFGWGFAMLSPIAIDRSAGKEALRQITERGEARIRQGFWVLIFPEGTRVPFGQQGRYGIGGAWLATHTGTPVVPVAHNAGRFWGRNAFRKYPGTITVSIGAPIETKNLKPGELNERVRDWIENELQTIEASGVDGKAIPDSGTAARGTSGCPIR